MLAITAVYVHRRIKRSQGLRLKPEAAAQRGSFFCIPQRRGVASHQREVSLPLHGRWLVLPIALSRWDIPREQVLVGTNQQAVPAPCSWTGRGSSHRESGHTGWPSLACDHVPATGG